MSTTGARTGRRVRRGRQLLLGPVLAVALAAGSLLAGSLPASAEDSGTAGAVAGVGSGVGSEHERSPGAATAPGRPHTVSWDRHSLLVDGRRTVLWSGEFHPFRLPSPDLWPDILQKLHSNGYNAVSVYVDWAYESSAPGVYDWTGIRDLDAFLDDAQRVGIYVIMRPGPYINAEVDAGGFPGWLTTRTGQARTNSPAYLAWSDEYQGQVDAVIARHQLTDGTGPVILYQIENENSGYVTSAAGKDYMAHLYAKARADGITVPIFHNDKGRNGYWVPGSFTTPAAENPPNYLYGFDGYPAGVCSSSGNPGTPGAPPDWGHYGVGGAKGGATASPTTPGLLAEFGGGWFDPWGGKLLGGKGYPCLRARQNAAMERQYYLTNVANGITIQNVYMTFGGTSWGWLPAPLVYSSYDYGAAIDEARNLTSKIAPMKELGYFLASVTAIAQADPATPVAASDPAVKTYHLADSATGTHVYFVRSDSPAANSRFTLPISTADGSWTVPAAGRIGLDGVDMKVLVADHDLGGSHLVYSTSEIMTEAADVPAPTPGDRGDLALLYTRDGQDGETVLRYPGAAQAPQVEVLSGPAPSTSWDDVRHDLRLDYTGTGLSVVRIAGDGNRPPLTLLLAAESVARTFWRLDTPAGPVIAQGPELLRSAAVHGRTLDLTGDTTDPVPLRVWSAAGASRVSWNGRDVHARADGSGALVSARDLPGAPTVTLPALTGWTARPESPESAASFDDNGWVRADRTTSASRTPVPAGQPVLFADDYGFHYGDVWYRGHSTATAGAVPASVDLTYQTGQVGMVQAWLDGQYLGAHQQATPTPAQATWQSWTATASFPVPVGLRTDGDHVLAVLVRPQGHEEDGASNDAFRNARGLLSAVLRGEAGTVTAPVSWRIQGVQGGETAAVPARGPLNNGGLYGERAGWYLPGHPTGDAVPVTLPVSDPRPGVTWYHTDVTLRIPSGVDTSVGLTVADDPAKTYRAVIFVNGWNVGQYVNDVGPQHTFVIPTGVLDPRGRNAIDLAVTSREAGGAGDPSVAAGGLGTVTLTDLGTVLGGVPVRPNRAPGYVAPRLDDAGPVRAVARTPWTGTVATVSVPADVEGTVVAATVDWGDGTGSAAEVSPVPTPAPGASAAGPSGTGPSAAVGVGGDRSGAVSVRVVSGAHTYPRPGLYRVTVTLRDAYGPVLDRGRTLALVTWSGQDDNGSRSGPGPR